MPPPPRILLLCQHHVYPTNDCAVVHHSLARRVPDTRSLPQASVAAASTTKPSGVSALMPWNWSKKKKATYDHRVNFIALSTLAQLRSDSEGMGLCDVILKGEGEGEAIRAHKSAPSVCVSFFLTFEAGLYWHCGVSSC